MLEVVDRTYGFVEDRRPAFVAHLRRVRKRFRRRAARRLDQTIIRWRDGDRTRTLREYVGVIVWDDDTKKKQPTPTKEKKR